MNEQVEASILLDFSVDLFRPPTTEKKKIGATNEKVMENIFLRQRVLSDRNIDDGILQKYLKLREI